jgi:hypothetical protein
MELHRRKGEVLLCLSEPNRAEAERCFRKAMAVAQAQGAKLWELRAATSIARQWRDQGKCAQAHDLLAPVYGWFTEGYDEWYRAQKVLPVEEGGGEMGTLIATAEGTGIDSMAIEQQLRELLALEPKQ